MTVASEAGSSSLVVIPMLIGRKLTLDWMAFALPIGQAILEYGAALDTERINRFQNCEQLIKPENYDTLTGGRFLEGRCR